MWPTSSFGQEKSASFVTSGQCTAYLVTTVHTVASQSRRDARLLQSPPIGWAGKDKIVARHGYGLQYTACRCRRNY